MSEYQNINCDAENALIGCLLTDNSALDEVIYLQPEDFGLPLHRDAYRAICKLINEGKSADMISVAEYIDPKNNMIFVQLCEIANSAYAPANIKHYAAIIKKYSLDRKLVSVAQEIISKVRDKQENRLDFAQQKIAEIADTMPFNAVLAGDVVAFVINKIDERQNNPSNITGISSGFLELDKITHGLHSGHLIILAARPAMGKTLLAMNIAEHVAISDNKTVLIFSLEMNREELIERSLASLGKIESDLLKTGKLANIDFETLSSLASKYNKSKLFIEDSPSLSVSDMRSRSRRIKREHGLDLVIIDYIGLVSGEGENETDRIGKISRSLKLLARDLNVPVLVVSQLNRGVEQRQDKRPTMADLRQSGAIEQDADLIMFIYREEVYKKQSQIRGIAEINIAKNRHGSLGTVYLTFNDKYCRFDNHTGFQVHQLVQHPVKPHFYDRGVNQ